MKKKLLILSSIVSLIVFGLLISTKNTSKTEIEKLREKHLSYLNNSPFKESLKLSKEERKAAGLPPNKYNEEMWSLTMDPSTGKPHPERVLKLQERLIANRVPGEASMPWVERGPDNVGGRTRAIMFDPNDATNKRVFAGGVSGGLWVNDDITDANSAWSEVNIPQNLGISCITYDPNDTNTFYVGTGESYVFGDVNGNGLWKSTDAGLTWTNVFGGVDNVIPGTLSNLTINSPGSIAGDYSFVPAGFGSPIGSFTGNLILVNDGSGSPTLACNALTNGGAVSGNIAVIERGNCEFGTKVLNAQNSGAVAAIVINNVADAPITMGPGANGGSVTIPSLMISQADGAGILTELGNGNPINVSIVGGTNTFVTGISHINDIIVRDAGSGVSEVFVAASDAAFRYSPGAPGETPITTFAFDEFGLFKSTNGGTDWTQIDLTIGRNNPFMPNDLEIAADNKVWLSTTNSVTYGDGGGRILSSSDGTNFSLEYSVPNADRTQIAVSGTNAETVYVLAEVGSTPTLISTTNGFTSTTTLGQPNDADPGIPATDFTRGQSFYDLMLEVDPTNDNNLFVGGIDIFASTDAGSNWTQRTHWYGGFGYQNVHADQHAAAFGNNDPTKMLFSNDGGVYYSSNSGGLIQARNTNFNTLQFYKGAIGADPNNEKLLAGAQDNGSHLINNASAGINSSNQIRGGDGCFVFIDKDNEYMIASYVYNSFTYHNYSSGSSIYTIDNNTSTGNFVNPGALDSANNILYTNGTSTSIQINRYTLGTTSSSLTALTNPLLTGQPTAFKPSTFTTTTLFVGTADGKLLKLTNANTSPTWTDITGNDFIGSISCVELGATENDIYVTFYNYGVTSVFYSNDGGATWLNKENDLPDFPVRAIMPNPLNANEVIVGTELGVWASPNFNDATPNWYQAQNGMKDVKVTSFDLRTTDNTVLASTYGRGMFTGQFTSAASGLSVDEFDKNNLITVYPTVSNGEITISSIADIREGAINVFDINGRNVYNTKVNFDSGLEQPLTLNLSSGMYILKFSGNDKQSSHKIIIE